MASPVDDLVRPKRPLVMCRDPKTGDVRRRRPGETEKDCPEWLLTGRPRSLTNVALLVLLAYLVLRRRN